MTFVVFRPQPPTAAETARHAKEDYRIDALSPGRHVLTFAIFPDPGLALQESATVSEVLDWSAMETVHVER